MQRDLNDVKKLTLELMKSGNNKDVQEQNIQLLLIKCTTIRKAQKKR